MAIKVHPSVRIYLDQIVDNMTRIYNRQKTYPLYNTQNEPEIEKQIKRTCVHLIKDDRGDYKMPIRRSEDGDFICEACGRKINIKFDQDAVKKIMDAIEVIDGLTLFATTHGLLLEPIKTLISVKAALPGIATIEAQWNEFAKRDTAMNGTNVSNLTGDYHTPERFTNITGYR